jgi:predicted negative regulator of RcsB-dependent stress response
MKRAVILGAVILIGVAYLAGFWPQYQRALAAEAEAGRLRDQLAQAEERVKLGEVLGRLLRLSDAVTAQNYGEAASLSTALFDHAQAVSSQARQASVKQALDEISKLRDPVTTAIARADSAVVDVLRAQQVTLRQALGYPVP